MKERIDGKNIRLLFSKNLKRLRTLRNLSQLNLANKADLAHNFINDIENGKKWVSPKTIEKLSRALNVEPHQFFLSDPRPNEQINSFFSIYLDDFSESLQKMVGELKERYIQDIKED
jgi:transcriptional regulator with XRE-family HTH domain